MSRIVIQANLLSGRYHAHPWGEAQYAMAGPEWPPSPWRLLRGLAAAWFGANPPPVSETERDELLQNLAGAGPPTLWLPAVSFVEIPYYQPIVAEKKHKSVLHFDHFAVLRHSGRGAYFCFGFRVALSEKDRNALATLLARMTYLGRTESRVHLSLVESPPKNLSEVRSANDNETSGDEVRRRVLVPCDTFRAADLWAEGTGKGHLVETMVSAGRRLPPNTQWLDYALPAGLIRPQLPRRRAVFSRQRPLVAEVRVGLFRRIPIPLSETVRVAREIRDQAVSNFESVTEHFSRRLTGREADGSISKGHQHASWLPEPNPGTGYLRRFTIRFPDGHEGIHPAELDALFGVQQVFTQDDYPILVVAERVVPTGPQPEPSRRWRSLTPFLTPLHPRRGRSVPDPSEQVARMVEELVGVRPTVNESSGPGSLSRITPVRVHRYDKHGRWLWTRRAAFWFELVFDHTVVIPRPLGAEAHFGLGQFVPATDRDQE